MDQSHTAVVLDALRARSAILFGDAHARVDVAAIFDRPYSTVMRLHIAMPDGVSSHAFAKIYRVRTVPPYETPRAPGEIVREEFAATCRLYGALEGHPGLLSPRPIVSLPEHGAIVTQELQGAPLERVLRFRRPPKSVPTLEAIATRVGTWLRAYQRSGDVTGDWSPHENRAYLDDRLRCVSRVLGESIRTRALDLFDRIADDLPPGPEPLVPIHADLCPSNIMVTRNGAVAVLDFATAQAGTRYHDIAHLYMHLDLVRARARRRGVAISPMQDSLVAAFDRADAVQHPLFRLMLLQHVVCHVTQLVIDAGWGRRLALQALARWRWRSCLAMPALSVVAPA